jgi:hypothetical protein
MEHINDTVNKIKIGLTQVANGIEAVANQPAPTPVFRDNEISGDKVHGGTISMFQSIGIADEATQRVMHLNDNGVSITNLVTDNISSSPTVDGDLTVKGLITAQRLHVDEITADVRNERTTPLEFVADDNGIYGKGLQWRGQGPTKQFIYRANTDRLYSTETIDISDDKSFSIGNIPVLTAGELGSSIRSSSLSRVGTLQDLRTNGNLIIDDYVFYNTDTESFAIGTESPNGKFAVATLDAEFIIDTAPGSVKLGSWTSDDLEILTDNTARLTIKANGAVSIGSKENNNALMNVFGKLGVGVNNVANDVTLSISNVLQIAGTKISTGDMMPTTGTYRTGDIVYNTLPVPTGYVGWVCIRQGTPGEWKAFGQISS